MRVSGTQCRLQGTVVSIIIVFVLGFFVFILFRFLSFRFSCHYFFVFILVFVNELIIFSFLPIFTLVFVNENHTACLLLSCSMHKRKHMTTISARCCTLLGER